MEELIEKRPEDIFNDAFGASASGSGEEELLKIGSSFSRQLSGRQMKTLIFLALLVMDERVPEQCRRQANYLKDWYMEYKQYNQSKEYVMRMFDSVSLRKFITSDAFKVNVMKG